MSWINLGNKPLILNQWVDFDVSVNGETFRFTPGNLQGFIPFKTYALVRMAWFDPSFSGNTLNYTQARRIYPKAESTVIDFPIPIEIKERAGGLVWTPQAMKQIYYRWRGRSQEPAWTLLIEDYNGP